MKQLEDENEAEACSGRADARNRVLKDVLSKNS